MIKIILTLGLMILLAVSCGKKEDVKKEEIPLVVGERAEMEIVNMNDLVEEASTFSDSETQKLAQEYIAYYREVLETIESKDTTKVAELQLKAQELQLRAQHQIEKLPTEDAKKWSEWTHKIADYMILQQTK